MKKYLATKENRSSLPPMSYSESPENGDGSDLACSILAVELVQLQAIVHKVVQNYTKWFRLLSCRVFSLRKSRAGTCRGARGIVEKQKAKSCKCD